MLKQRYTITDEGYMEEYSGVQLEYSESSIQVSQLLLTNRFIEAFPGITRAKLVKNPVLPSVLLTQDMNSQGNRIIGTTG